MKRLLTALQMVAAALTTALADRYTVLNGARNLMLTTDDGYTYYYIISAEQSQKLYKAGSRIVIARDTFDVTNVQSLRYKTLPKFVADEDSTSFGADYAVDHGLMAFRRSFNLNRWNSLVVPFSLTAQQLTDAFGEGTMLARVRGISEGEQVTLEFETIATDLPNSVVVEAGQHYLIRPTREPDVARGAFTPTAFGTKRVAGPLYLIPNASMAAGQQSPDAKALQGPSKTARLRISGSYAAMRGASLATPKVAPGNYVVDDYGLVSELGDSLALQAFRSWITDRSKEATTFRFYIDGISEDITGSTVAAILTPSADRQREEKTVFDLTGRRVGRAGLTKGIYIVGGKKTVVK